MMLLLSHRTEESLSESCGWSRTWNCCTKGRKVLRHTSRASCLLRQMWRESFLRDWGGHYFYSAASSICFLSSYEEKLGLTTDAIGVHFREGLCVSWMCRDLFSAQLYSIISSFAPSPDIAVCLSINFVFFNAQIQIKFDLVRTFLPVKQACCSKEVQVKLLVL